MLPKLSKVSDSIYLGLDSVDRGFEMIEKFKNFCSMGAKVLFFKYGSLRRNHHFSSKFKPFLILNVSKVI